MGIYDMVGNQNIQVKCTRDPSMKHYKVGDEIELSDGLFIGHEGWFVVKDGKILTEGRDIFDKWGDGINLERDILSPRNPLNKRDINNKDIL